MINNLEYLQTVTPEGAMAEEREALENQSVSPVFPQMPAVSPSDSNLVTCTSSKGTAQNSIQRKESNVINLFRYLSFSSYK